MIRGKRGIKGERGEESNVLKLRSVKDITLSSHRGEEFMVNRPLCGFYRQNKCVGDNKALRLFKVCAFMRFIYLKSSSTLHQIVFH